MRRFVEMPEEFHQMNSAVTDLETLNGMARSLERSEARRIGTTPTKVRKIIARRLGITKSSLENFLSRRTKVVPHWLMSCVRAELISVLQLEVQNLEHEIQLYRQAGADHSGSALVAIETQLATARQILREEVK
jgi:hypothetical protein